MSNIVNANIKYITDQAGTLLSELSHKLGTTATDLIKIDIQYYVACGITNLALSVFFLILTIILSYLLIFGCKRYSETRRDGWLTLIILSSISLIIAVIAMLSDLSNGITYLVSPAGSALQGVINMLTPASSN